MCGVLQVRGTAHRNDRSNRGKSVPGNHLDRTLGSMDVASAETAPRVLRRMSTAITVGVILLAVLVLILGYVRVGWDRMEQVCTADPPGNLQASSVAFGWSWSAPGFTCTYDDGQSRSSLWF
jgi:hypothetical protein